MSHIAPDGVAPLRVREFTIENPSSTSRATALFRNHWFKKLNPSDSRATKHIQKDVQIENRNTRLPWTRRANFLFCSSHFVFAGFVRAKKRTKKPRV